MEFKHKSVLLEETIDGLRVKPDGTYVDGTLGGAGHAQEVCRRLSAKGRFIGIDQDQDAIVAASERLSAYGDRVQIIRSNYCYMANELKNLGIQKVDGIVLDLGVSSYQLDNEERGFTYRVDAPLDMRMNRDDSFTASDVINKYDKQELTRVISGYGEERWASRIAEFIVKARKDKPIETTFELVDVIKAAIPASARRTGPHPAKRTFQAVRIEVNEELSRLEGAIDAFLDVLAPGGRLCIITFHSLEDRIVKEVFNRRANPCTCPKEFPVCICGKKADIKKITGKPVTASRQELECNPRARSAKLRVAEKI